jgi:hypothetical protein
VTAAGSYKNAYIYLANFYRLSLHPGTKYYSDYSKHDFLPYPYTTGLRTIILGSKFYGSIREVRVWSKFLTPGEARKMYKTQPYGFHSSELHLYYKLDEGLGNSLLDMVSGTSKTFSSTLIQWVTYTNPIERLEICESENIFSE